MKVILVRDVPKLGREGQLVEVEGGYGRNYLIPRGLAVPATKGNLKAWQEHQKRLQQSADRLHKQAEEAARQLDGKSVVVRGRTAPNSTKLFGTVTAADIAEAIYAQHHIKVDKRRIDLIDPIRYTGTYTVNLQWSHDLTASFTVEVVGSSEEEKPPQ